MSAHWHSGIWIRTALPYISVATVIRSRGISKHLFKDDSTASRFSALQSATEPKGNIRLRTPSRLVDSKAITKTWTILFRWVNEVLSDLERILYRRELIYSSSLERGYSTVLYLAQSLNAPITAYCISMPPASRDLIFFNFLSSPRTWVIEEWFTKYWLCSFFLFKYQVEVRLELVVFYDDLNLNLTPN
jgi:hypothetical protein